MGGLNMIKLIPDWRERNLRCHFCNTTESVKYEKEIFDPVIDTRPTKVCVCNKCALNDALRKQEFSKDKHMTFNNARVIIKKRRNGLQPAIFIIDDDGIVHLVTITPDHNFVTTNEGLIGERYDENGNWCGE